MRVAFVGKGGSGKTTLSALFSRHLARSGAPVVAIDADINQHLADALGLGDDELRRAAAGRAPGRDQGLPARRQPADPLAPRPWSRRPRRAAAPGCCACCGDDPVHTGRTSTAVGGVRLMVTGAVRRERPGRGLLPLQGWARSSCTSTTWSTAPGEYVVVDMTAGADSFASGLFTRFDLTFLVAEPTRKGVSVYRQYRDYAADYDVPIAVVGNKVTGRGRPALPAASTSATTCSPALRAVLARPRPGAGPPHHGDLEPHNLARAGPAARRPWTPAPRTGPPSSRRPSSSTCATPGLGQRRPPARTSPPRSTRTSSTAPRH